MDNSTVPSAAEVASLQYSAFLAYSIVLTVIILVAGVMSGFTILALLMAVSIPRLIRIFLINLLLSSLLVAVSLLLIVFTSAVLVAMGTQPPTPRYLCRVYLWAFASGVAARLWSLTAFSFSVLAIVRFNKKTISVCCAAVIIPILWLVPMAITLYILLPAVYEAQFIDGVACFPDTNATIFVEARLFFFTLWSTCGGVVPLIVSIIVPIVCLCYIKRNIVTEGKQYRRGMANFSLFLVLGGVICIAGQILPAMLSFISTATGVYLTYGFAVVSLLPTPIIILAYLKQVREQAKKIVTCGRLSSDKAHDLPALLNPFVTEKI